MIPKLTDEAISMLPLESGRAELLEEIMTTVAPDRQTETTPPSTSRRIRWVAPLAAAAVVAGLAGGTVWWQQHGPEGSSHLSMAAQLGIPEGQAVVLDAPGWHYDGLGDGVRFRNGDATLEITTYAAKDYDSYVTDREHINETPVQGHPIEVLGHPALMWAYSATDHTAIREVVNGRWMELRADGVDKAGYLALLGQLRMTSEAEFEASLPDGYVTVAERPATADKILLDIKSVSGADLPSGVFASFKDGEAKDRYQFGAEVAGVYACAWLEAFENATTHEQADQAAEAARVLGTSRQWPILNEMNAEGDYPEVVWELSAQAVAGTVPDWYREGLGCP